MDLQPKTHHQQQDVKGILIGMVNKQGMVTIPKALRNKYQLTPNSLVVFNQQRECLAIKKSLPTPKKQKVSLP